MNLRDYKLAGLKNTKFKVRFHGFYFSKLSRRHEPTQKTTAENSEETTRMAASGIDSMKSCQVLDHSSTRSLFPGKSITLRFTRLSHLLTQKKLHTLTLITLDIIITYAKELKSCWSFPRVSCCKTEAVGIMENRKTDYSENIISLHRTPKLQVTDKLGGRFSFQWNCGVASRRVGGRVKHENLVPNNLTRVKFPPWKDMEADVSSVRPSSSLSD